MRIRSSLSITLAASFTCWATAGQAQNLSPTNPEFDGFASNAFPGWTTTSVLQREGDDADGCPLSGSFRAESTGSQAIIRTSDEDDCVPVATNDVLYLEVTYRSDAPVDLGVVEFPNSDCTGSFISMLPDPAVPESADWTTLRVQKIITFEFTNAVRLRLRADDSTSFVAEFDRAYLGRVERIFADDFDGGSFCRWDEVLEDDPI